MCIGSHLQILANTGHHWPPWIALATIGNSLYSVLGHLCMFWNVEWPPLAKSGCHWPTLAIIGYHWLRHIFSCRASVHIIEMCNEGHWPTLATCGHHWPWMAITGHHWPWLATTGHHWPLLIFSCRLSVQVIVMSNRSHWPTLATSGHHWPPLATNGHQWPKLATTYILLHGIFICNWNV